MAKELCNTLEVGVSDDRSDSLNHTIPARPFGTALWVKCIDQDVQIEIARFPESSLLITTVFLEHLVESLQCVRVILDELPMRLGFDRRWPLGEFLESLHTRS
jgi:hypothetical protein